MLVYEKKLRGRMFQVFYNGTVVTKSGKELGYINDDLLCQIVAGQYSGFILDEIIRKGIKIPLNAKTTALPLLKSMKPKLSNEKAKKIPGIYIKKLNKYKEVLTDLEFEVLRNIVVNRRTIKNIARKLGYHFNYIYIIKYKALKKIYGKVSKLPSGRKTKDRI